MIVATHLLSALSYTSTHVDKTELVADGKGNEEMEVEIDKLGPDQARSMLTLLTGTGYQSYSAPCTAPRETNATTFYVFQPNACRS